MNIDFNANDIHILTNLGYEYDVETNAFFRDVISAGYVNKITKYGYIDSDLVWYKLEIIDEWILSFDTATFKSEYDEPLKQFIEESLLNYHLNS